MTTRIEDCVKATGLHISQLDRTGQYLLRSRILFEALSRFGLTVRGVTFGVQRWLTTFG